MIDMAKNMEIYNLVRDTPKEAQKSFNNGKFSGTDVNPMFRIKRLTEVFGAAGIGWYTEVLNKETLAIGDEVFAIVDINLYVKNPDNGEWSKPIFGTGGNKLLSKTKSGTSTSDEGFKMAYTDAISVACKALGIAADIYYQADKSSKYAQYYTDAQAKAEQATNITPKQIADIRLACTPEQVSKLLAKYKVKELSELSYGIAETILIQLEARKNENGGKEK